MPTHLTRGLPALVVVVVILLAAATLGSSRDDGGAIPTSGIPEVVEIPAFQSMGKAGYDTVPPGRPKAPDDRLESFRGLSTWIDTYDVDLTPEEQVGISAAVGVDAIYVQASRQSTDGLIHDPDRLARTIELAHDHDIKVMVWTIPDFRDLDLDRDRAIAAMSFTTPRGDRPDAFGLDIEIESMEWVPIRTRRLLQLSAELREWAGPGYPMAAIVLPPKQLELNTAWWPDFPYAELTDHFDVFVPMSYSSYRGTDAFTTLVWNRDNVILTRQLAGDPDLPVHLAGGIANRLPEVEAFVQAAVDADALGGGLYDLHTTPPEAWPVLQALSNERQGQTD